MPHSILDDPIVAPNSFPQTLEAKAVSLQGPVIPEFLNRTFVELFERQVEAYPTKVAIIAGDQQLTYAELNRRANHLAHRLRSSGVRPESIVGICIDRSLELAIGIVGILKSGGAYLPLDPEYPSERLAFMIRDARPAAIVTKSKLSDELGSEDLPLVLMDEPAEELDATYLSDQPSPSDLAYVIYTSGSTGTPKGAMIEHANLANYLLALNHELEIRSDDVYLHLASIAFSSSRRQLLLPLSQGATVVIAGSEERKDPLALFEMIKEHRVTVMDAVPSFWRSCTTVLQQSDETERNELIKNDLRLMLSASEPLTSDIPRTWTKHFQHPAQHVHMFGQTETAGIVCVNPIALDEPDVEHVSIGNPIPNTEIFILDEHMNPCVAGAAGELYIGGAGVGRAYLNRPELTREKFITINNARLYRTGDFARRRRDGSLEFAGRRDQQIKIRGFRVEVTEVEAALYSHPAIRECAVTVRGDTLVAFVVHGAGAANPAELRTFLNRRLPDHAVPSTFIALETLPLSANGKVDRLALMNHDVSSTERSADHVAPSTETEKQLAAIVGAVLHIQDVSVADNFLELGGNSLLAGQVIARVRRTFNVRVPISVLFESPTIAGFAARLDREIANQSDFETSPTRVSREQPLPLSFSQQRLWFLDQLNPGNSAYNLAHAMKIDGALDLSALRQSLDAIVARHEILRTRFVEIDGTAFQKIDLPEAIDWRYVDLSHLPVEEREQEANALLETQSRRPFHLATGPLFRALVMQSAADEFMLLLTMHHILSDGWSAHILMRELSACYEAFADRRKPSLNELRIQYADYAVWQRDSATNKLDSQLAYWKQQLADAPPVLNLPTDHPRTNAQTDRGGKVTVHLPRQLSDNIRKFAREHRATLFMALLAVFDCMLATYCGSDDIVLGSPVAGRDGLDTELLVGFFVNTLALRTKVSADLTVRELIERVRQTALTAFANQDVPFEMLVSLVQRERSLDHNPIFQVMFVLQDKAQPLPQIPGARVQRIDLNNETSKFDLSLEAVDSDEIEISISYNAGLFESESARLMLGDFQRLLEAAIANADARLSQLPKLKWIPKHRHPESTAPASESATAYVPPNSPIEETLASIWKDVLKIDRVGVDDNFFSLGGHSLMAAQVISRIRAAFDFEMPLRQLFETPTVRRLAHVICEGQVANTENDEFAALLAELDGLSEDEALQRIVQEQAA
jgi:amino acid adenylation domain-containing protein